MAGIYHDTEKVERVIMDDLKDQDFACIKAGLGGGFTNIKELHPIKYKEAIKTSDKVKWLIAVEEEHRRMHNYNIWKTIESQDVPLEPKIITST